MPYTYYCSPVPLDFSLAIIQSVRHGGRCARVRRGGNAGSRRQARTRRQRRGVEVRGRGRRCAALGSFGQLAVLF